MGKRTNYSRHPRDLYPTPLKAALPLLSFIRGKTFCEPCAAQGRLIRHLSLAAECVAAYDIHPLRKTVNALDASQLTEQHLNGADMIITNPPWHHSLLYPMLDRFIELRPTWLLLSAALVNNERFGDRYMPYCSDVQTVGRVSWMNNGKGGYDDAAWYRFDRSWNYAYYRGWKRKFDGR